MPRLANFAVLCLLVVLLAHTTTAMNCPGCDSPNKCVADNVCLCNGNHFRPIITKGSVIVNGTGTAYKQECYNLRGADNIFLGAGLSCLIMIVSIGSCGLVEFYLNKDRKPRSVDMD